MSKKKYIKIICSKYLKHIFHLYRFLLARFKKNSRQNTEASKCQIIHTIMVVYGGKVEGVLKYCYRLQL